MFISNIENQEESVELIEDIYGHLVTPQPLCIAETKYPYLCWTERHVQVMWWEKKYFKNLKTKEGLNIEIISAGIWNSEAGPDFLKAHLKIGDRELKGDVEIHLSEENWIHHKHHQDARYDNVILHVVLWKSKNKLNILTSKDQQIWQTYLEDHLTISETRILQLIDLDQYPYRKFLGSGHCAKTLFSTLSEKNTNELFQSAAEWRLRQKIHHLKCLVNDSRMVIPAGIALALGYKNNSEAFFELFMFLMKQQDKTEKNLLAIALGLCGFFSEKFLLKWKNSAYYQDLYNCYINQNFSVANNIQLNLHQIRPLNHPIRRFIYLIKLICDPLNFSLQTEILYCWKQHWPSCYLNKEWVHLYAMIADRIPSYKDAYWNSHYLFEEKNSEKLSLVGKDFKEIVIINCILPMIYDHVLENNQSSEFIAFRDFYRSMPAQENSKARYLKHRLFGDKVEGLMLKKAMAQQGAFQIHKDFCTHYEASCAGCTFVEQYAASKSTKKMKNA